jgi:DNA-binding GntR family transcriptional regulator
LATDIEQAHLNMGPDDKVLRTQRISEHAGRPHVYEEATLAIGRLPSLSENALVGLYLIASLAWKYGTYLTRASERLSFAEVPPEIAELLLAEPGVRLLRLDRIVFSRSDAPIEWRVAFCDLKYGYYLAESR